MGAEWVDKVKRIPIPRERDEDEFYWTSTQSGEYSVKSGYWIAFDNLWVARSTSNDRNRI